MLCFNSIRELTDPKRLCTVTGPISKINQTIIAGVGFSGSELSRVQVLLYSGLTQYYILKCTRLDADWLSQRAGDRVGREFALLGESALSEIWNSIHCPYVACASENGKIGLLMNDYSSYLFPDVKEPIDIRSEDLIMDALAALHATFWESSQIMLMPWIAKPMDYLEIFAPGVHPSDTFAPPPDKIRNNMQEGWNIALKILSPEMSYYITKPARDIFRPFEDLPFTLLHGDAKIANMAILPEAKVVMFDWPLIGRGPCGI